MANPQDTPLAIPGRSRVRPILLLLVCALILFGAIAFLEVGKWLVVEDSLTQSRAIAVLSGNMPLRAIEAARLYRQGYAQEIWLTHSTEPGATLEAMSIPFAGEDFYNTRIMIHEGVPPGAIRVLEPPIVNTADEIKVIASALSSETDRTVIIVTTKAHTRRTRLLWRRLAAGRGRAIVRAASGDLFEPDKWWRTSGDALDVVREVLGLMNAWAGLPLRPAQ
jgi:uncharacterized SAM-binding protein YcdF (DUF218 family)